MAFFDSPKNRAIWERELKSLRAEKERRAREGYRPQTAEGKGNEQEKENPFRKRISLSQLEEKLAAGREKTPGRREWSVARRNRRQMEKQPEMLKGKEL